MKRFSLALSLAIATWACDDGGTFSSPTSPAARPPAPPVASGPPPSVTALSPSSGLTGGDAPARVIGTGFRPGATVTFGGATVPARSDHRDPARHHPVSRTPAHAAGSVDVVVTNPDGQSARLTEGYTYAPSQSFDFNGAWSGFGNAGQDVPIGFTIQNNLVLDVSCHGYSITTMTFSPPLQVSDGTFSFSRDDGVAFSGRIVSSRDAVGTINFAECTRTIFGAWKR